MSDTQNKIAKLKKEIQAKHAELLGLEARLKEEEKLNPDLVALAKVLHKMDCRMNHTDGCGWEYEPDNYFLLRNTAKSWYYEWATNLAKTRNPRELAETLEFVRMTPKG